MKINVIALKPERRYDRDIFATFVGAVEVAQLAKAAHEEGVF